MAPTLCPPTSPEQRRKVAHLRCLVCGRVPVDPAPLVPWALGGCESADCVIPLCRGHHRLYDAGEQILAPFLRPELEAPVPFVTQQLAGTTGPVVAVTDYNKSVPDQIRQFVPGDYAVLGADGFGFSDTRAAARRFFKIDAHSVVVRTLGELARRGEVPASSARDAIERYDVLRRDIDAVVADLNAVLGPPTAAELARYYGGGSAEPARDDDDDES